MTVTRCWRYHPVPKNQQVLANFVGQTTTTTTTTTSWYETKALDSSREGGRGGSLWGVSATQNVKRKLCKINYNWKQMNAKTISSQRIPRKSHKAPTATLPIKIKERPQGVAQERERGGGRGGALIKNWGRWNKCSHLQNKQSSSNSNNWKGDNKQLLVQFLGNLNFGKTKPKVDSRLVPGRARLLYGTATWLVKFGRELGGLQVDFM